MKKTILALVLAMLMLTGCSGGKTVDKPTLPTEPAVETTRATEAPATQPTAKPTEAPQTTVPPVTETLPPPTTAPTAPPAIVITKHPTSETVSEGGRTWFIAKAENETQITWEFFSPDGTM